MSVSKALFPSWGKGNNDNVDDDDDDDEEDDKGLKWSVYFY